MCGNNIIKYKIPNDVTSKLSHLVNVAQSVILWTYMYTLYAFKFLKAPADSSEWFDDALTTGCGVILYCHGTCNNQQTKIHCIYESAKYIIGACPISLD